MKIGIVGSRIFNDWNLFCSVVDQLDRNNLEIISGGAMGADTFAYNYAKMYSIPITMYLPDGSTVRYTKDSGYNGIPKVKWAHIGAGLERNTAIVEASDKIIAFSVKESKGTADTIRKAETVGKPVWKISI